MCANEQRIAHKTESYDEVLKQFEAKYHNKYIYPESNRDIYVNKKSKIKIICPKHGEFEKSAQKHLSGQGCFRCKIEELVEKGFLPGGYCEEVFNENPELKDVEAYFYYFKINNGQYYKVGITKISAQSRINSLKVKAKAEGEDLEFEVLGIRRTTLYKAFKLEQAILEKYKDHRKYRKWSTELLDIDIYDKLTKVFC